MSAGACSVGLALGGLLCSVVAAAQEPAGARSPGAADAAATERYTTFEKLEYKVQGVACTGPSQGEATVTLYNKYPSALHNVRLHGRSDVLDVRVEPEVAAEFQPTAFLSFSVRASLRRGVQDDRAVLPLAIGADELVGRPSIEVTIPFSEAAAREVNDALALPVGTIEVRVSPYGNLQYYAYILATLAIIAWLIVRKRRAA